MEAALRNKVAIWGVLAAIVVIALTFLSPPIPRTKARAQHIATVNNVAVVSLILTNTSPLPASQPSTNK
jgi:hypothetical protein